MPPSGPSLALSEIELALVLLLWAPAWDGATLETMVNPYAAPNATVGQPDMPPADPTASATVRTVEALRQTRPWVLFLAIMGFISAAFMVVAGIAVAAMGSMVPGMKSQFSPALGLVYIALTPLYVLPSVKLLKYAGAISRLNISGRVTELEEALLQQKGFWKLVGVMVVAMMVVYALAVVGIVIFAVLKATHAA